MTFSYKEDCVELVKKLDSQLINVAFEDQLKQSINNFLEVANNNTDSAVVAFKFNAFVQEFERNLLLNDIGLSKEAGETWNKIMELFSSSETRSRIQPFVFSKK